jgi:hypothetical protein
MRFDGISPTGVIKIVGLFRGVMERLPTIPRPDVVAKLKILTPEESQTEYHVVISKVAFKKKADAETFADFYNRLSDVIGEI